MVSFVVVFRSGCVVVRDGAWRSMIVASVMGCCAVKSGCCEEVVVMMNVRCSCLVDL